MVMDMEDKKKLLASLNGYRVEVLSTLSNLDALINKLSNEITTDTIRKDNTVERNAYGQLDGVVIEVLKESPEPLTVAQVVAKLRHKKKIKISNSSVNQVNNLLNKLEKMGDVIKYKEAGKSTIWMVK